MDFETGLLFAIVAVIGANQVVMRSSWAQRHSWLFWGVNLLDIVVGSLVLVFGLPGFASMRAVSWVVGLLLVAHVAQNLQLRSSWQQAEREEAQAERDAERKARRQARADEAPTD